jgi:hypothetical protein
MPAESNLDTFDPDAIPAELKAYPQWVSWRYVERGGKRTKMPVNPRNGLEASVTDPSTWGTFEEAVALPGGRIGFVFYEDDPFCGVDFDAGKDPKTGQVTRPILDSETGGITDGFVAAAVTSLDSYTEYSPSGDGLHVIVRGELPGGRNRKGSVEMYDRGRFFTVTGRPLPGRPPTVEDRHEALAALHRETFGGAAEDGELAEPVSPAMEDDEVLERCRRAKNAEKFAALFDDGDLDGYGGDHSAADQALVGMLSFYTQDPEQLDRLFRQSELVREKWTSRPDYRERTINKALTRDRDYYGAEREYPAAGFVEDESPDGDAHDARDTMTPVLGPPRPDTGDACDTMTPGVGPLRYRADGVPFPLHALPPSLRRYLREAAHAKEAPVEFVALPMLAALGVAIGASRRFRIERTWLELPTLYAGVVAPPASGKSPAEDAAMLPVYRQSKVLNQEYRQELQRYKDEHQAWEREAAEARKKKRPVPPEPEKPVKRRIRLGDATVEALQVRMAENPRGLVLARDELAGFFTSLNQYKGGRGADRQFWLSQHSGRVAPVDRKTDEETYDVEYPCVSVVGSIQPEKLHVLDIEAGDGMVERFLFAWPDARTQPDSERDITLEAEDAYREVWDRLHALKMGEDEFGNPAPEDVPLATESVPAWKAYRRALKRSADEPGVSSFMRGVIGKTKAHFPRFALILALVRTVEDGEAVEEVREEDLANAWELAGYFVAQSYRVYAEFKKENKDDLLAHALGQFLDSVGGKWEGTATELFDAIAKLGFTRALPKKPDALTQAVRKAARNSPTLTAEKGQRSAEARSIVLRREYPEGGPGGASERA